MPGALGAVRNASKAAGKASSQAYKQQIPRIGISSYHQSSIRPMQNAQPQIRISPTFLPNRPVHSTNRVNVNASTHISTRQVSSNASQSRSTDGRKSIESIHPGRLRDACKCPQCVNPSTRQRNFRSSDIPNDIRVKEVTKDKNGNYVINWSSDIAGFDQHSSVFSQKEVDFMSTPLPGRLDLTGHSRVHWDKAAMAKIQYWITYEELMNSDDKFGQFLRSLRQFGLVFIKDIPEDQESIVRIANRMGPLRNSFYGLTWDVRNVPQAKNVAYTNQFLDFHMDLLYMDDPPAYQFLHCIKNSLPGGESLFADSFRAALALKKRNEDYFNILARRPVRFGYDNDGHLYERQRPTIETSPTGEIERIFYSPPFQQPAPSPFMGDDTEFGKFQDAMRAFVSELEKPENIFELKLNPGECVLFANLRVVHARKAFGAIDGDPNAQVKGDRWLRGAYVDQDAMSSKFQFYRSKDPKSWDSTP